MHELGLEPLSKWSFRGFLTIEPHSLVVGGFYLEGGIAFFGGGGGGGGGGGDGIGIGFFLIENLKLFFFFLRRRWGGFGYVGVNGKFFFFLETVGSFFL